MISTLLGETLLALETEPEWNDYDRYYYMSSPIRDKAIVLSTLLEIDPQHPQVPLIIEALKKARLEGGYWSNTQENAYALMALSEHAKRASAGKASVRVLRDGKVLATLSMNGGEAKSFRRTLAELPAGEITIEPSGPVYVALRQRRVSEVTDNAPVERGFAIERTYFDLASRRQVDTVRPGQLVRVAISVCPSSPTRYVALVDPLPSGFEPVNSRLSTEEGTMAGQDDLKGRWEWSYTAQHDDQAVAFNDQMNDSCYAYEHVMRATSAGTFTTAPAHVEAMYEPSRMAMTSPAILRVTQ